MSFTETCRSVAEQFIQTVVVIDDRGFAERPREAMTPEAAQPDTRGYEMPTGMTEQSISSDFAEEPPDLSGDPDPIKHDLDGMGLTRRFGAMGINCAVYVPDPGESCLGGAGSGTDWTSALLARRADIVVVDWLLDGRTSRQAREFIKCILQDDRQQGGRLRLLAVYTGADDLQAHRRDLHSDLTAAAIQLQADETDGVVALSGPQVRVVFLHKDHEALPLREHVVSEADLPVRLVTEFSRLAEGIMPAVALAAISAVRDATHTILAKFNRDLDPALAAHRSMLETTSDAEDYALRLVSEELHVRIDCARPDRFQPSAAVFGEWVDHLVAQGREFNLTGTPGNLVSADQVKALLADGASKHEVIGRGDGSSAVSRRKVWRHLTTLFSAPASEAELANLTFSRMALLGREAYGKPDLPGGWLPTSTLGAVIALVPSSSDEGGPSADQYYVCLQPRCDAVRIPGPRPFPLLPLGLQEGGSDAFSLVVRTRGGKDLRLQPRTSPFEIRMVVFPPAAGMGLVRGERGADGFQFRDTKGRSFEWLGEMRSSVAQRVAQQMSSQFGRVGLDEFEWLRLSAES